MSSCPWLVPMRTDTFATLHGTGCGELGQPEWDGSVGGSFGIIHCFWNKNETTNLRFWRSTSHGMARSFAQAPLFFAPTDRFKVGSDLKCGNRQKCKSLNAQTFFRGESISVLRFLNQQLLTTIICNCVFGWNKAEVAHSCLASGCKSAIWMIGGPNPQKRRLLCFVRATY